MLSLQLCKYGLVSGLIWLLWLGDGVDLVGLSDNSLLGWGGRRHFVVFGKGFVKSEAEIWLSQV